MTPEEVLGRAGSLEQPMPGLYRTDAELVSFEVPNASPMDADLLRSKMGGLSATTQERCIGDEEARLGFENLVKSIGEGVNGLTCRFERFETAPPSLNSVLACEGGGVNATIGIDGTAEAEGVDLKMVIDTQAPPIPGQTMKMVFSVSSERIGDCPSS